MNVIRYFDSIGVYGPIILNITSIILLWNKQIIMWAYIQGSIVSIIINSFLKIIIKDPEPVKNNQLFKLAIQNQDINVMPCEHSQSVGFSCAFIYLSLYNFNYFLCYLSISIITMIQRFTSKSNTISQIIIGFILGISFAYITTLVYKQFLIKELVEKTDDECYI